MRKLIILATAAMSACVATPANAQSGELAQNIALCKHAAAPDGPGTAWLSKELDKIYSHDKLKILTALSQCSGYIYAQIEALRSAQ